MVMSGAFTVNIDYGIFRVRQGEGRIDYLENRDDQRITILVKTNERGTRESDHHSPPFQLYRSFRHVCHIYVWIIHHHLTRAVRSPGPIKILPAKKNMMYLQSLVPLPLPLGERTCRR